MTSSPPPDSAALLFDQRWLAALARGLVGDEHAVEDVLQETRLRAWRHPPADSSSPGGWLRRVASNVALSMRSSESARRLREVATARPEGTAATDELVARVEMQRAVAEAVLRLDEPYRAAILLRFFDDLPPREIAARLGLPVETVRTHLKRGLAQLRGQLDRRYGQRGTWAAILAPGLPISGGVAAMSTASKIGIAAVAVLALTVAAFRIGDLDGGPASRPVDVAPDVLIASRPDADIELPDTEVAPVENAAGRSSMPVVREGVRFSGIVLDADTFAPVADAIVTLRCRGREPKTIELETRSRADGSFEVGGASVTRTVYSGEVSHAAYATTTVDPSRAQSAPAAETGAVGLGAILMLRGTLVSGRVVALPDRSPVGGADLFVCDHVDYPVSEFGPTTAWRAGRSRVDGTFDLERRVSGAKGPLAILAVSEGRIGFAFLRPESNRDRLADFEVPIEPPGSLVVHVVDEEGHPVPDVELTAAPTFPPFGRPWYQRREQLRPEINGEPWQSIFRATTGADGRARFALLPEGRNDALLEQVGHVQSYWVHASATGRPNVSEGTLIARGEESTLEIKLGSEECRSLVRGRILDEQGQPIAGALVRVEGFPELHSSADGRYASEPRKGRLGRVQIQVSAAGFAPDEFGASRSWSRSKVVTRRDDPSASPLEELERDFTLARATNVRGKVVDEHGAPMAGIVVKANGLNEARTNHVTLEATGGKTDVEGAFLIEGVSVDFLSLSVDAPEGFLVPFPVRVVPGDQNMLVTMLRAPAATGRAIARVFDSVTGAVLDPVSASPRSRNAGIGTGVTRCTPGQVTVEGLILGSWELIVHVNDGRRGRARFEVTRPDETVELQIAIEPECTVEGVLFDSAGEPMRPEKSRWWVWVRPSSNYRDDSGHALEDDGRPVSGLTGGCAIFDEHGRFRVGRLPPGVPIRFVVDGTDTSAHVTVELKAGESRRVEFHLKKSADVRWQLSETLPFGRLTIETSLGDEPFAPLVVVPTGRPGTRLAQERMSPGRMRWRAEFTSSGEYPPRVRVATGQIDLVPGEPAIVDVLGFE